MGDIAFAVAAEPAASPVLVDRGRNRRRPTAAVEPTPGCSPSRVRASRWPRSWPVASASDPLGGTVVVVVTGGNNDTFP